MNGTTLNTIRPGLTLAALFGWLLSFPMFGRFLLETAGDQALTLGVIFIISHAAGLLILHLLPSGIAAVRIRPAAGVIAALTIAYSFFYGIFIVDILLFVALGFTAAYIVLAWAPHLHQSPRPMENLAIAMIGSNLVYTVINIPVPLPVTPSLALLAALAMAGTFALRETNSNEQTSHRLLEKQSTPQIIKALAAFIIAIYFIGGIWYYTLTVQLPAAPFWEATIGSLIYIIGIILMSFLAIRSQPANLASYSLSAVGIGLLIAFAGSFGNTMVALSYLFALNIGLAAADLFLWYALWFLGRQYGSRRVFGLGLGFSLLFIALAVIISATGMLFSSPSFLFITALALLFLVIPIISRHPFRLLTYPPSAEKTLSATKAQPDILKPPDILTPSERRVYKLLVQGASDTKIAEELVISKHTVKFHVRNILRKLNVKNRIELLSRLN